MAISKKEVLMGRDIEYPADYTKEISDNIDKLLKVLNVIREAYGKPLIISSGWRPPSVNAKIANAAKKSLHMQGLACDFKDADGKFDEWLDNNQDLLESLGAWQESCAATPNWAHIDIGVRVIKTRPNCKKRQFNP